MSNSGSTVQIRSILAFLAGVAMIVLSLLNMKNYLVPAFIFLFIGTFLAVLSINILIKLFRTKK